MTLQVFLLQLILRRGIVGRIRNQSGIRFLSMHNIYVCFLYILIQVSRLLYFSNLSGFRWMGIEGILSLLEDRILCQV